MAPKPRSTTPQPSATALIIIPLLASLMALLSAIPAHAALQPNVIVSAFSIKEGSAEVGKDFTLVLTLADTEPSACAQAITTSVQSGPPFIMDGLSTAAAGDLCYGSTKTLEFPMRVDPTAAGGFYQITVASTYETSLLAQYSSSSVINLLVNGTPDFSAAITGSDPIDVYPGDTAAITVDVQNNGAFSAQAVIATLNSDAPLEVKWAGASAALGTIGARQGKSAAFTVEVPKDAAAKDYPLRLDVQYLDQDLAQQERVLPLVFHVKPKAKFETADAGSDALFADQSSRSVKLLLKNTGTDAAHKLKAKILPQFPFSSDGSVRYVETLGAGSSVPVDFTVGIDKDATPGTYGLDMLVQFEDAQGKQLQDTAKVSLTVERKNLFRAVFLDYWFLWLALILVVFLVARRRMKKPAK